MGKLTFALILSLAFVCIYAQVPNAKQILKFRSDDTNLDSLWNHYENKWGKISYYNLRMTEEESDELLEALVKIFEETSDTVERAERFHSKWYEMFPERQNSVALSTNEDSTVTYYFQYGIRVYLNGTRVFGFGLY
ncbi:hypothetical protein ILUMI_08775 [Ignelater luminosus]|uniref:Uncharacterized protein n=1 Tax=Ignelater luminosus TaxID=2038154 RepID=A0A8K0D196_IGNLU|nr:hypothetical protein ILUMI_08775 [Ignelater luminosus]